MPGERYHSNYSLMPAPDSLLPPLQEYVARLQQSGKFRSVQTNTEAVFDIYGQPYEGAAAIFVIPNPEA